MGGVKQSTASRTGTFARFEIEIPKAEVEQPVVVDQADPASISGVFNAVGEGEDAAKLNDDSASTNPNDAAKS
jgi:hypothetical protein